MTNYWREGPPDPLPPPPPPPRNDAIRMFQISEEDLATLERVIPELAEALTAVQAAPPRARVQMTTVKRILADVRWNYGPHTDVERVE